MLRDHWREFPQVLNSIEQIPSAIRAALGLDLPKEAHIIHIYLIPQQRGFWEWFRDEAPRTDVFVLTSQEILIGQENQDKTITAARFKIEDIVTFEVGTILLRSWIKFKLAGNCPTKEITLEFETIFQRQFRHSILWLRHLLSHSSQSPEHAWRMNGEEHIKSLPLKFNNAARNYWLLGESALASCFIRPSTQRQPMYKRLFQTEIHSAAIVVSNEQVCVINEQGGSSTSRWGQIWHFYSHDRIATCNIMEMEKKHLWELRFSLKQPLSNSGPSSLKSSPEFADMAITFAPQQLSEVKHILRVIETFQNRKFVAAQACEE